MGNRKSYEQKLTVVSGWVLKAIGLVFAGAATVLVVLTIAKGVSTKSDAPKGGKYLGVRHEAGNVGTRSEISKPGSDQALATASPSSGGDTVVRNGVTVVSPQLLVPVIDMASLQAASGTDDNASVSKASNAPKRSGYTNRSHARRQTRWKAYGFANR